MPIFKRGFAPGFRLAVRLAGNRGGASRKEINRVLDGITNPDDTIDEELIETAALSVGESLPAELTAVAEGDTGAFDGSILKKILDFFASPQGQAIIKAIFSLFGIALLI